MSKTIVKFPSAIKSRACQGRSKATGRELLQAGGKPSTGRHLPPSLLALVLPLSPSAVVFVLLCFFLFVLSVCWLVFVVSFCVVFAFFCRRRLRRLLRLRLLLLLLLLLLRLLPLRRRLLLGDFFGCSWVSWGWFGGCFCASWGLLGASFGHLGRSWGGLGRPWGHLARTREGDQFSGRNLSRFLDRLGGPKGRPDDPKTTP